MQSPRTAPTDGDIHQHIYQAILARRLQPGERLIEHELARLFRVSRTKIRAALLRLAQDGIVETRRNQGAAVAAPTKAAIRDVVQARCFIEPAIAAALAARAAALDLTGLRDHVEAEQLARTANDEPALVQLTGEFHLKLAALHGNALLIRLLRDAEALMVLGILSYGRPNAAACLPDEHRSILDAIANGERTRAAHEMEAHLHHIASEMDLDDRATRPGLGGALRLTGDWAA